MPSELRGLHRTLTWNDFQRRQEARPRHGRVAVAAHTATVVRFSGATVEPLSNEPPVRYELRDSIAVQIELRRSEMYVKSWVFDLPEAQQAEVLAHEQGHYDLSALLGRDMFNALMQLKGRRFDSTDAALATIRDTYRPLTDALARIDGRYDQETRNGRDAASQQRWKGYIRVAFTELRRPRVEGRDGEPLKVPLLEVLNRAGITI